MFTNSTKGKWEVFQSKWWLNTYQQYNHISSFGILVERHFFYGQWIFSAVLQTMNSVVSEKREYITSPPPPPPCWSLVLLTI
jgi:hypothetical protein